MGILSSPLNTYKPPGSTFNFIRKHVSLKELESWLKRGQYVRFLREICPRKNIPPKDDHYMTAIAWKLLIFSTISYLTGLQLMPHICGMEKGSFFQRGISPIKIGPKDFWRVPSRTDILGNMPRRCAIQNSLKYLELKSHHHDNGNVLNRSSMDIDLFRTNLSDEI
jgi:hypothetical protein